METSVLPDFMAHWNYADPAGTETAFRGFLIRAQSGAARTYHAELLTQIARAQGLQRRFDDAHKTLDQVEPMLPSTLPSARVRYLLERGRTLNSSREPIQAKPLFEEAWRIAEEHRLDGLAVDAAHMIAIVESPDEALRWNQLALELANTSADPDAQRWKGSLCNNIGWTHHGRGQFDKALDYFQQAFKHRQAQGKTADIRVARWCVARCLRSLGRTMEALAIQRELESEMAGSVDPDGFVYEELAECLYILSRTTEAQPYFKQAHDVLSRDPGFLASHPERLQRLHELAETE